MRCPSWKIPDAEIGAVQRKRVAGENAFQDMHRRELELQQRGFAFSAGGDFDLVDVLDARRHDQSGVAQGLLKIEVAQLCFAGGTRRGRNRDYEKYQPTRGNPENIPVTLAVGENCILDLAPLRR